jgi:hypothetical protein
MLFPEGAYILFSIQNGANSALPLLWIPRMLIKETILKNFYIFFYFFFIAKQLSFLQACIVKKNIVFDHMFFSMTRMKEDPQKIDPVEDDPLALDR